MLTLLFVSEHNNEDNVEKEVGNDFILPKIHEFVDLAEWEDHRQIHKVVHTVNGIDATDSESHIITFHCR